MKSENNQTGRGRRLAMKSVVHCKKDLFDVYIGRPSKWGNPFVIGRDGTREQVIQKFESYLKDSPHLIKDLSELEGKTLGCYCSPLPCHGDVLVKFLMNKEDWL